jgi:RNA-directed DNA polymerase
MALGGTVGLDGADVDGPRRGVKGGKWFSLIDKVTPESALDAAFRQVVANRGAAGVDHVTVAAYEGRPDENLKRLSEHLREGTYRPQAIRRHDILKAGSRETRPLGIPTVPDRVVQTALRMVLEPIFEREFAEHSSGFRPGRGCKDALRRGDDSDMRYRTTDSPVRIPAADAP